MQPWLSPRCAPAPPSASATRSPARRPEPDPRPLQSRDRDLGRPAMTATAALLPVLLLLLAFGHTSHGEPPGGLARAPSGEACDAPRPPGALRAPSRAPQLPPVPPNPKTRAMPASPSLRPIACQARPWGPGVGAGDVWDPSGPSRPAEVVLGGVLVRGDRRCGETG